MPLHVMPPATSLQSCQTPLWGQCPSIRARLADLFLILLLVVYGSGAIVFQFQRPYLLALLLLLPVSVLVWRLCDYRRAVLLAATGAVLGPLTEVFCVAGGLWTYSQTGAILYVPPWLPVAWACFPPALWLISRSVLGGIPGAARGMAVPVSLAGIGLMVAIFVSLGHSTPLTLAVGLPAAALVYLAFRQTATLVLMAGGSLIGPLCESMPVAAGAWHYALPEVLGMPGWLPLAYALFAALVCQAALSVSISLCPAPQPRSSQEAACRGF
ncbi:MAG: hypothetical protein GKC10_00250 [Methanosarcinales archaeon]|nr:hypothetical protein [Methanosarcinales archaeon]